MAAGLVSEKPYNSISALPYVLSQISSDVMGTLFVNDGLLSVL